MTPPSAAPVTTAPAITPTQTPPALTPIISTPAAKKTNATAISAAPTKKREWLFYGFISAGLIVFLIFLLRIILYLKRSQSQMKMPGGTGQARPQPRETKQVAAPQEPTYPGIEVIISYLKQGFEQNVPYHQLYTQLVKTGWAHDAVQKAYQKIVEGK